MTDSSLRDNSSPVQTTTYERLAEQFDHTFTDVRGGVSLEYITGEQVTTRLNDVLGPGGWAFRVLKHDIHPEADEVWVLGELTAKIDGETVVRQQFGSQKIKRSRSTGAPLDLGFDLKGGTTDAMKKAASLIGVGLYLSHKTPQQHSNAQRVQRPTPIAGPRPATAPQAQTAPRILCQQPTGVVNTDGKHELCGKLLEPAPDRGWTIPQLANEGVALRKRPMCLDHFTQERMKQQAS